MNKQIKTGAQDNAYKSDELPKKVKMAVHTINRNSSLPLYQQLLQRLYTLLESGELEPGSFFATEVLLQKYTGMSRATIRKALEELVRKGMLVRVTGKGTFVTIPNVQIVVPRLRSLTQELTERGMKPGSVFLGVEWSTPPEEVAKELNVIERVLRIRRIRTGNGVPLIYSCVYIPPDFGITPETEFGESLYKLLSEHGRHATSAIHTIKAVIISKDIARLLGVEPQSAGLKLQRTTFDNMETPIMYEEGIGRGDQYSYTLEMQNYTERYI